MRVFLAVFFLFLSLFAQENVVLNDTLDDTSSSEIVEPKVLYLSYKDIPARVIKGEVFSLTIKTLSVVRNFSDITYHFSNSIGIKVLNKKPFRNKVGKYYHDTFYMMVTKKRAKTPDITASLVAHKSYRKTVLKGQELNVISLNPNSDFSNVIANNMSLQKYKTTTYDDKNNIIVFVVTSNNSNIDAFHLKNVKKQGVESKEGSFIQNRLTYYAVIDKHVEELAFSYFNLLNNKYEYVRIPIIVNDESIATQSDLKPKDQSKERLKMIIALGVALFGFIIIIWRKRYIYLIFVVIPLIYVAYIGVPQKQVCIKKGANIYLLPVRGGTVFETTKKIIYLQQDGHTKQFVKVRLLNDKIGWVKNEDICSH